MKFKIKKPKKKTIIIDVIIIIIIATLVFFFGHGFIPKKNIQKSASSLCTDTYDECKAVSVISCNYNGSTIYRVDYDCADTPVKYFDSNLVLINDSCWGMPVANQTEPPQICYDLDKGCKYDTYDSNICK